MLAEGLDPQRELASGSGASPVSRRLTFAAVCNSYFQHQLRGAQAARSRREIEHELLPLWNARRISDISKGDVIQVIDALRARAAGRRAAPMLESSSITSAASFNTRRYGSILKSCRSIV